MSKRKRAYDEVGVVRQLNLKRGCNIDGKTIEVDQNQTDLGNSSWGKIDYLIKAHGYKYDVVDGIHHKQYSNIPKRFNPKQTKVSTKSKDVNMSSMIKQVMGGAINKAS